jgi:hypothetical protein
VLGKLPHRDQLDQQCATRRATLHQQRERRTQLQVRQEELSKKVTSLAGQLTRARDEAARIGYDPELDQKLAGARDRATRLRAERGRLEKEAERSRQADREAAEAEAAAREAAGRKERAGRAKEQADQELAVARATLGEAN